ncbi:MAG: ribbon-helix-helix protein, CopG family [Gemmatimonadota bacterium]
MARIISVSLPADLLPSLDAEAQRQRRSRSFIVAEAVREYLAVRDRAAFEDARNRTLREGLALSPTERAALADELWRDMRPAPGRASGPYTRVFKTLDEYDGWKRRFGGLL